MYDIAIAAALLKNQHRIFPAVHKTDTAIDTNAEIIEQIAQTAGKTPLNICHRDVVPAVCEPFGKAHFAGNGMPFPRSATQS
jgi:hypothetical protein